MKSMYLFVGSNNLNLVQKKNFIFWVQRKLFLSLTSINDTGGEMRSVKKRIMINGEGEEVRERERYTDENAHFSILPSLFYISC